MSGLPVRRGSVYLLAVGMMSLLVLLLFGMSRHTIGRSRLVSLSDQKQTALFALEACYGDMVSQMRVRLKDGDQGLIDSFKSASNGGRPAFDYIPGPTLAALLAEQQIRFDRNEIVFENVKPLEYPPIIKFPADHQSEKKGQMVVTCVVEFLKRQYELEVKIPFKTVFTLTPMLRQFVLFADQIHLEQREAIGDGDRINVISVKKGGSSVTSAGSDARMPMCLGLSVKPHDKVNTENEKEGYVFLGASDKDIVLNLAGEVQPGEGDLSDLWQVTPECFKPIETGDQKIVAMTVNSINGAMQNKTLSIPLKTRNTRANLRLVGFCEELEDERGPWFRDLKYTLERDSVFSSLLLNRQTFKLSSSLKLLGPSFEAGAIAARIPYPRNVRNIFGRVYNRFFVLGTFDFPSAHLYTRLLFSDDPSYQPPEGKSSFGERYAFETLSGNYQNYMSRIMSGRPQGKDFDYRNIPANLDENMTPALLDHEDFLGVDGIKLAEPLENFAEQWIFDLHSEKLKSDLNLVDRSVIGRITRVYRDQNEFMEAVGLSKGKLMVDGVVAVDGDLDLADLGPETEIRGGIVLVNGKISLGNIMRDLEPPAIPPTQLMLTENFRNYLKNLEAQNILTFISLTGDQICLKGNVQLGVHLVSLKKVDAAEEMLTYENPGKVIFAGALALSTPCLDQLTRKFRDELPLFCYPPEMAAEEIPMAVVISDSLEGYQYVVR
ncbi:MAG: hypothetical protein AB1403_05405 [Candidatus Riflebacteria bacterium]